MKTKRLKQRKYRLLRGNITSYKNRKHWIEIKAEFVVKNHIIKTVINLPPECYNYLGRVSFGAFNRIYIIAFTKKGQLFEPLVKINGKIIDRRTHTAANNKRYKWHENTILDFLTIKLRFAV